MPMPILYHKAMCNPSIVIGPGRLEEIQMQHKFNPALHKPSVKSMVSFSHTEMRGGRRHSVISWKRARDQQGRSRGPLDTICGTHGHGCR